METGITTGMPTYRSFTPTVTTSYTVKGINDNDPGAEEPREGKALKRGSELGVERATALPTITL